KQIDGAELEHVNSLMRRYESLSATLSKAQEELDHVREQLVDAFVQYPDVAASFRRSVDHPANKVWRPVLTEVLNQAEAKRGESAVGPGEES
ncbi:MAG: hypothetical protein M3P96_11410, partial [Actinomycetota bacterium]|nr:hypothetical protein [Actinomycetota bacterium]